MRRLKTSASMDNFDKMIDFIVAIIEDLPCNDKAILSKLHLVCEEVLLNIIKYAYGEEIGYVEIIYKGIDDGDSLIIEIVDEGVEFNPLESKTPKLDASLEERSIGGLGLYLIKEIMDELRYRREDGKNILTLIKCIS